MHVVAKIEKDEGEYLVRLYSYPKWHASFGGHTQREWQRQRRHWESIKNIKPVELEADISVDDFPEEALGEVAAQIENELLIGKVITQNFKLTFKEDDKFFSIVKTLRDPDLELWLELSLEQRVPTPPLDPLKISEPRQRRLIYWGRAIRNEGKGNVDDQELRQQLIKHSEVQIWSGEFSLNFQHWSNVVFNRSTKEFFTYFKGLFPVGVDSQCRISRLLYYLLQCITPSYGFAIADQRLEADDEVPDAPPLFLSISRGNLQLNNWKVKGTNIIADNLNSILVDVAKNGVYRPLFYEDPAGKDHGALSLHTRWKTYGEALVTLCREFRFKPQIELPCFEDIKSTNIVEGLGNPRGWRRKNPDKMARWLFLPLEETPLPLDVPKMTVFEESIEYTPAAVWVRRLGVSEPDIKVQTTAPDFRQSPVDIEFIDEPFDSKEEPGQEYNWETLFSLMRQSWSVVGGVYTLTDYESGIHLSVTDEVTIEFARQVLADGYTYNYWSEFHFFRDHQLWSSIKALLEFEFEAVGIMEFGKEENFGLLDYGDFPMQRGFTASPGMLYSRRLRKLVLGNFTVIELKRTPGGNSKVRALELAEFQPISLPPAPDPGDPPPDPPHDPPDGPPNTDIDTPTGGGTISGTVEIAGTVTNPNSDPVQRLEIWIGGAYAGSADFTTATDWTFDLDTTLFSDGVFAIMAKLFSDEEHWSSAFITVTIDNVGGGGGYTDEQAQDAVGGILAATATITPVYDDVTPAIGFNVNDTSITAAKLATDAVETAKIKDANVTAAKLATDAVETLKIKDANVTAAKLATDAVETAKIKDGAVTYAKLVASAATQTTPAAPLGTTSSTGVMMGMGGVTTITPATSGRLLILISGTIKNNTGDDGAKVQIRYGTGSAPANGDALTGNAVGGLVQCNLVVSGSGNLPPISPFSLNAVVTGLSVATTYWIDASLAVITGGTATITDVSISVVEI